MTMLHSDNLQSGQLDVFSYRNPHTRDVQLVRLFTGEELHAYLLVVPPGGRIERHTHENKHELFDVLEPSPMYSHASSKMKARRRPSSF